MIGKLKMGTLIEKFKHEFIFGGHLLSLGATSIVWSVLILLDKSGGWPILLLAYLASQIVYNYDHLSEKGEDQIYSNQERTKYLSQTKKNPSHIFLFYVLCFFLTALFTNWLTILFASALTLGGILYTQKLKKITKKIIGFKSFYVSLFWSGLIFLPLSYYSLPLNSFFVILFLFIFSRFLVSTIFFDIKDIKSDAKKGLKTFPVVFGIKKTIFYSHIFNIFSGLILIGTFYLDILPNFSLILLIFPLYSLYYLIKVNELNQNQIRTISYILVDGEYIFWPLSLMLGKLFLEYS